MRTISRLFLLLCLIGITLLIAGCMSQPGNSATSAPDTTPAGTATTASTTRGTVTATKTVSATETERPGATRTTGTAATGAPTMTPGTSGTTVVPTSSSTESEAKVRVRAKNMAFDTSTIPAPAGSLVVIEFENEDNVGHNIAFYTTSAASTPIYRGQIISGPDEITYTFTAPSTPGTYFFRCDPHPSMNGQFVVT